MLQVLLRIVVNGLALVLTALLLPGIHVVQQSVLTYVLLAAAIGLINTYVRPAILLFTGQYVIASMGLLLLVINGALLLLVSWLFPNRLIVSSFLAAIFGGAFLTLFTIGLELVLGLTRPIGKSTDRKRPSWYGFDRIPYSGRNRFVENLRIQQVYNTFYRYGVDMLLDRGAIADFRARMQKRIYTVTGQDRPTSIQAKTRLMLEELGPIYVKMGQMVASQAQALPEGWHEELEKLQSSVPPFPAEEAREIITRELGAPPEALYAEYAAEPFAAASTAQVHRARTKDDHPVVVKVQRPNITTQVNADLGIMQDVANTLEKRTRWAVEYNLAGMIGEYASGVTKELDYTNEAYNAARLARNMAVYDEIHVPDIYFDLSTSKVLTMEFVSGVKIANTAAIDAAGLDRIALAEVFVRSVIKQILIDGFFHADPHPGNILVNPETGVIYYLDMGMMGALDREQRMNLADLILSLYSGDFQDLGRVLVNLTTAFKPVNKTAFFRDLEAEAVRYTILETQSATNAEAGIANVMNSMLALMHRHGLRLNQDLTLAFKAIMQAEEAAMSLDPMVDVVAIAVAESKRLIIDQVDADYVIDMLRQEGLRSAKAIIRRIPSLSEATMKWLDQYESGQLTVHLDTSDLAKQVGLFTVGVKYLSAGLVLMGLIIGTAVATNSGADVWSLWQPLARVLFLGALLLSAFLVIRIFWSASK